MQGQIIERIDTYDITERIKTHSLEFFWEGGPRSINFLNEQEGTRLLTHVRYRRHGPFKFHSKHFGTANQDQEGFCLQVFQQLKDFERLIFNQGAGSLSESMAFHYGGDDFQLFNETHYERQQILLEFFQQFRCRKLNVKWSTASNYFQKLKENIDHKPKVKYGDFFPYQEDGLYWTAFYTTYPEFKLIVRQASLYLQSIHFYFSQFLISTIDRNDLYANSFMVEMLKDIQLLREEVSLAQHHDGITGTSKYWVHDDILRRLRERVEACAKNLQTITQLIYVKSFVNSEKVLSGQGRFRTFRQLENVNVIECSLFSESKQKCIP